MKPDDRLENRPGRRPRDSKTRTTTRTRTKMAV